MTTPIRPPVAPGKIPHRIMMAKGKTRRDAFERAGKYAINTALKYAARDQSQIAGPAYYDGYISGVKAERERLGLKWKIKPTGRRTAKGESGRG